MDVATTTSPRLKGYWWIHRIWDGFKEAAEELGRALGVPLCVENCGLCCVNNTPTSLNIEADRAATWLMEQTPEFRNEILDRIENWLIRPVLEVTRPADPGMTVTHPGLGATNKTRLPIVEFDACARGRCPLLDQNLRCSVHEVRPMACRAYGVTRLAGAECIRPPGIGESATVRDIWEGPGSIRLATMLAGLKEELKDTALVDWEFFPTALYKRFRPQKLAELAPQIPTARLAAGKGPTVILFERQLLAYATPLVAKAASERRLEGSMLQ